MGTLGCGKGFAIAPGRVCAVRASAVPQAEKRAARPRRALLQPLTLGGCPVHRQQRLRQRALGLARASARRLMVAAGWPDGYPPSTWGLERDRDGVLRLDGCALSE